MPVGGGGRAGALCSGIEFQEMPSLWAALELKMALFG